MKKRNLYKLISFVFIVVTFWSLEANTILARVEKINLSSNLTIEQLFSNGENNIFSSRNRNFEDDDKIVYSSAKNLYINALTTNRKLLDVQLLPSSVLSPVIGPLRVTSSNQGVVGFWEFNQYPGGGLHTSTGGIAGSDDRYAWDVNQYLQGNPNADAGKEVYATADGDVVNYAGVGLPNGCKAVLIAHPSSQNPEWYSGYLHLASYNVSIPQHVTSTTVIGRIGRSCATNDHLHFVIYTKNASGKLISFNANITERTAACSIPIGQGTSVSELTAFRNAYRDGGGQIALGCPTASVRFDGFTSYNGTSGHYQTFQKGEILYHVNGSRAGQAFAIEEPLRGKWASYSFNNLHPLGYPTSSISQQASSCYGTQNRYQGFERGSLSQHSGNIYEVHGAIHTKWQQLGFAGCPLGLPTSDETTARPSGHSGSTGKLNQFQGGQIYWKTGAAEAFETHGWIKDTYVQMGGSESWLGFPTSDEFIASTGHPRSNFEGGYITWDGTRFSAFRNSTCNYSISPSSQSFTSSGGSGTINVTTTSGCNRTGTSNVSWISITSGGTGSGAVGYSVAPNSGQARTGTITIAGQNFTVSQSGVSTGCASPATIGFLQTINGTLQSGDCIRNNRFYDAYTFNGAARQRIYITLNSAQFDTYLYLYRGTNVSGTAWNYNDDGGGGTNSRIPASGYITLPSNGIYTILASSYFASNTGTYTLYLGSGVSIFGSTNNKTPYDFDSDGKTDYSLFRPSNGVWYFHSLNKNDELNSTQFGISTDKTAPADYDGDGRTDIAVFREGIWHLLRSTEGYTSLQFGMPGDLPQPADFDGDGKAEIAVFRPSTGTWYWLNLQNNLFNMVKFGTDGDKPVASDYDGDGKADIAIYRPSVGEWWLLRSSLGVIAFQFGNNADKPVQGDYTGDGKADVAFFRPSTREWYILRSENQSYYSFPFGIAGDSPSPGDYDGDGKSDAAVFRSSNNTWWVQGSTAGTMIQSFGQTGDKPIPNSFVP